jgi:hypothetical protein
VARRRNALRRLDEMTHRKREIIGLRNERDFPHVVELALPLGPFRSVFLEIDAFHRERRLKTCTGERGWVSRLARPLPRFGKFQFRP